MADPGWALQRGSAFSKLWWLSVRLDITTPAWVKGVALLRFYVFLATFQQASMLD